MAQLVVQVLYAYVFWSLGGVYVLFRCTSSQILVLFVFFFVLVCFWFLFVCGRFHLNSFSLCLQVYVMDIVYFINAANTAPDYEYTVVLQISYCSGVTGRCPYLTCLYSLASLLVLELFSMSVHSLV